MSVGGEERRRRRRRRRWWGCWVGVYRVLQDFSRCVYLPLRGTNVIFNGVARGAAKVRITMNQAFVV